MPENVKTAYKVARKDGDGWMSAVVNGKACVHYAVGERSSGFGGTPVVVFLSAGHARNWQNIWPGTVLLRGRAGRPRLQDRLVQWWEEDGLRAISVAAFWNRGDGYRGNTRVPPPGTHAADWFEPEKEVSR